jgi:hypothetical protein
MKRLTEQNVGRTEKSRTERRVRLNKKSTKTERLLVEPRSYGACALRGIGDGCPPAKLALHARGQLRLGQLVLALLELQDAAEHCDGPHRYRTQEGPVVVPPAVRAVAPKLRASGREALQSAEASV